MRRGKDEDTSNEMDDGERRKKSTLYTLFTLTAHVLEYYILHAQNKNGIQQGGSTVGVALSYSSIMIFLVKGTALAKKKPICAEMTINTSADF